MKKTILLFIFSIFFSCGQNHSFRKMEKKRKQEFISSQGFKEIINFFYREEITLHDFDKEIGFKDILKDSSYSDLPDANEIQNSKKWLFHFQETRNLDFNISQVVRGVVKDNDFYFFNFAVRNDTIIGLKFSNGIAGFSKGNFVLFEKYNDKKFKEYFQEHKSFFKSRTKKFGGELGALNLDNFGSLYNGTDFVLVQDCKMMINQVNRGNKRLLKKWLISMNPEKQAFAVQGFYYLQKHKDVKITKEEQKFINHIQNLDRTIRCNGNTTAKTEEVLNSDYFDKEYLYLKKRGLIK